MASSAVSSAHPLSILSGEIFSSTSSSASPSGSSGSGRFRGRDRGQPRGAQAGQGRGPSALSLAKESVDRQVASGARPGHRVACGSARASSLIAFRPYDVRGIRYGPERGSFSLFTVPRFPRAFLPCEGPAGSVRAGYDLFRRMVPDGADAIRASGVRFSL